MGVAVTMLLVLGTAIILVQTALTGYNSLLQCAPKAILDGSVIAMLMGRGRRWRQLALLGPVYGLVLLLQTGIVYLPIVVTAAAVAGALTGALVHRAGVRRLGAVLGAAVVYELLVGAGRPLHIYFGTGGGDEPLLWLFYFLEWPLRIVGVGVGVWIGWRYRVPAGAAIAMPGPTVTPVRVGAGSRRPRGVGPTAVLGLALAGCVLPMVYDAWWWLGGLAGLYMLIGWATGLRRGLAYALVGLAWAYGAYALASYVWHQDAGRLVDLVRTVVLRFMPLTISAAMILATLRPVELVRVLRRWGVSPAVLLPLSSSLRALPAARRRLMSDVKALRTSEGWRGPLTPVLRPRMTVRALFAPQFHHWAGRLAESTPGEVCVDRSTPQEESTHEPPDHRACAEP